MIMMLHWAVTQNIIWACIRFSAHPVTGMPVMTIQPFTLSMLALIG
jgi:hypothetical protein